MCWCAGKKKRAGKVWMIALITGRDTDHEGTCMCDTWCWLECAVVKWDGEGAKRTDDVVCRHVLVLSRAIFE